MSMSSKIKIKDQIIVSAVFAALGIVALAVYVLVAEPVFRKPRPVLVESYDESPLEKPMDDLSEWFLALMG